MPKTWRYARLALLSLLKCNYSSNLALYYKIGSGLHSGNLSQVDHCIHCFIVCAIHSFSGLHVLSATL